MEPIDQHPPNLMQPAPPQVLFFGEFRPKEGGEVDEVRSGCKIGGLGIRTER